MKLEEILSEGFPTHKDEAWKYTNLSALSARPVIFTQGKQVKFLNCEPVMLSKNFETSGDIFDKLNQYFYTESYEININENNNNIEIIYDIDHDHWVQPRIKVIIEKNVEARITEKFLSQKASIMNAIIDIELKDNAKLTYIKHQEESPEAFHIGRSYFKINQNAQLKTLTYTKGSQLSRSDIGVKLVGQNASCDLNGLYITQNRMHVDHHTVIEHIASHTKSREFYRGVLSDKSRAVFNGKVVVHPGAIKTEALQANDNLLLSSEAEIDTKPELEIYCDDVKCTHGATIGQLDEKALFYLRSRGMPESEAKHVLVEAFGNKVLREVYD